MSGAEGLVEGCPEVGEVVLVEIDVIDLQPLQTGLEGTDDEPSGPVRSRPRLPELRGQDDLVPSAGDGIADVLLGATAAVDVGGVEEVHPHVERGMYDGRRLGLVQAHAEVVAAEAGDRHLQAGVSQSSVFHSVSSHSSTIGPVLWSLPLRGGGRAAFAGYRVGRR
jgi:hypothetical protein